MGEKVQGHEQDGKEAYVQGLGQPVAVAVLQSAMVVRLRGLACL